MDILQSTYLRQQRSNPYYIEQFDMSECNPIQNVYWTGFPIDRIPDDNINPSNKATLVKTYQSLVGGLNWWSSLSSHPEITMVVWLLA